MGKIDKFIIDNTTYELVPEIAPLFNPATPYSVGDCVIHDAVLYKFTANHTGAWTGNDVVAFEVGEVLSETTENINSINNALGVDSDVYVIDNWVSGYFPVTSETTTVDMYNPTSSSNYVCQYVECEPGDVFSYTGTDASGARAGVFISSATGNGNVISRVANIASYSERRVFSAPVGSTYLLSNSKSNVKHQLRKLVNKHQILAEVDANDLMIPGTYYCHTAAISSIVSNIPAFASGKQFTINVDEARINGEYIRQILFVTTKSEKDYSIFLRYYTTSWGDWREFYTNATHELLDIKNLTLLEENTDLDDVITYGSYYSANATLTASLSNVPFFVDSGFSLYVFNSQSPSSGANYVRQIIFANKKAMSSVYTRAKNRDEGGWGDWQLLISGDMYEHPKIGEASTFTPSARIVSSAKKTIRVGTNNVAHYWLQGYAKQYLNDYPIKIAKWRRWLMKADLDVLFLQECEDRINKRSDGAAVSAFATLYAPFFDSDTNIDSDSTAREDGVSDITSSSRRKILNRLGWTTESTMRTVASLDQTYSKSGYYNWAEITLENSIGTLLLINIHNFAGESSARVTDRVNYLSDVASFIQSRNPTYFILAGDFNLKVPENDYANLLSFCSTVHGKPVNGGIIGWFVTSSAEETDRPYDNIIVSENIEIKSIECDPILVAIGAIHTDHLPVVATLELH